MTFALLKIVFFYLSMKKAKYFQHSTIFSVRIKTIIPLRNSWPTLIQGQNSFGFFFMIKKPLPCTSSFLWSKVNIPSEKRMPECSEALALVGWTVGRLVRRFGRPSVGRLVGPCLPFGIERKTKAICKTIIKHCFHISLLLSS